MDSEISGNISIIYAASCLLVLSYFINFTAVRLQLGPLSDTTKCFWNKKFWNVSQKVGTNFLGTLRLVVIDFTTEVYFKHRPFLPRDLRRYDMKGIFAKTNRSSHTIRSPSECQNSAKQNFISYFVAYLDYGNRKHKYKGPFLVQLRLSDDLLQCPNCMLDWHFSATL